MPYGLHYNVKFVDILLRAFEHLRVTHAWLVHSRSIWDCQDHPALISLVETGGDRPKMITCPGARPTKHISIEFEIRWKFKTL